MTGLLLDLRWALRRLVRRPASMMVVVLSLGLATGAVTAVFSVVYGTLLRPLPVDHLDRLVRLRENWGEPGGEPVLRSVNPATFRLWRSDRRLDGVFEGIAAGHWMSPAISTGDRPEEVTGSQVTANLLPVLGVEPILGRQFREDETRPGADSRVVLIGYGLWQRRFGGSDSVLGKDLRIDGEPHRIVGVLPEHFAHPYQAQVWTPLVLDETSPDQIGNTMYVPARLAPGVSLEEAQRRLSEVTGSLAASYPLPEAPQGAQLEPLREELLRDIDSLLLPLLAGAGLVLIIACANVSSLLLALGLEQRREQALRVALGAGGRREARPFLLQGLILALGGGVVGVVLAAFSIRPLVDASPLTGIAIAELGTHVELDWPVLLFTAGLVILLGFGLGLLPALVARHRRPQELLRAGGAGAGGGPSGRRGLAALVAAEFALAVILLAAAGLSVRSFEQLRTADRGYRPGNLLVFDVTFHAYRFPEAEGRQRFTREAVDRIGALPGVVSAAGTSVQPYWGGVYLSRFDVPGQRAPNPPGYYGVHHRMVTPRYLETLGVPILAGRGFNSGDRRNEENTPVIVSRSMAERFWTVDTAIGQRVHFGPMSEDGPWLTVVGVAGDLAVETSDEYLNLNDVRNTWYLPADFDTMPWVSIVVRTAGPPKELAPDVRRVMSEIDSEQPIGPMATMSELEAEFLRRDRFAALLGSLLAAVGLVLAAAGLFALVAFSVAKQRRDMGIRMALGAEPWAVRRMVLRQGLVTCLVGIVLGLGAALLVTRQLAHLFHGVSTTDPATFLVVLVGLCVVALVAAWVPARRATRIDPAEVLRSP